MKSKKIRFDDLPAEEIGKLFPVRIIPYDPNWKVLFEKEKDVIEKTLGKDLIFDIEHFGSTSVEGLASKPTIDILVEVENLNDTLKQIITLKLATIGYEKMHNAEKENKMTFGKGYDGNYSSTESYHIHIREKSNQPQDEIYFRDNLRQNPDIRDEYAKLKYSLAEKYEFNRESYTQAKTEFVTRITQQQKRINNQ